MIDTFVHNPYAEIQVSGSGENPTTMTIRKGSFNDHVLLVFTNKHNSRFEEPLLIYELRKIKKWLDLLEN